MTMDKTCATCRYCEDNKCHFWPPVTHELGGAAHFPHVNATYPEYYWCGQWKEREDG